MKILNIFYYIQARILLRQELVAELHQKYPIHGGGVLNLKPKDMLNYFFVTLKQI